MATTIENIRNWDFRISKKINAYGSSKIVPIIRFISFFGRETIWLLLIAIFVFIWYDPIALVYIGGSFAHGVLLIVPLKKFSNRKRPFIVMEDVQVLERKPLSSSFPSWHSYNVASQALIISFLLNSVLVAIIMFVLTAFVAFSRVYLGVHYLSDVISGIILGIVGSIIMLLFIGPFYITIIQLLESYVIHKLQYFRVNSMLYTNFYYLLFVVMIFALILLFASFKKIKEKYN